MAAFGSLPAYSMGMLMRFASPSMNVGVLSGHIQGHMKSIQASLHHVTQELEIDQLYLMLEEKRDILENLVAMAEDVELTDFQQSKMYIKKNYSFTRVQQQQLSKDVKYFESKILKCNFCSEDSIPKLLSI